MKQINMNSVMKDADKYSTNPASFCRAVLLNKNEIDGILFVSGTASVGENGETLHKGDFKKQVNQTFYNLTQLLEFSGFSWKNVFRTTIYLRDIDRDYEEFNKLRKEFFESQGITRYPASTCIGAKICRSDLLCEIELMAANSIINERLFI